MNINYGRFNIDLFNNFNTKNAVRIDASKYGSDILEHIKNLINKNPQVKLFLEFNPELLKAASQDPDDLLCCIDKLGFDIYLIKDQERQLFRLKNFTINTSANLLTSDSYNSLLTTLIFPY
jgi:hypothetical protein